jgi:hypothetical protein
MKAVEGWLKMNLSMLQMTIQSLEMQCVTLNAVRTMGNMASSHASASPDVSASTSDTTAGEGAAPASMWPWNMMQQMQEQMQQAAAEHTAASNTPKETDKGTGKRGGKSQ